MDLQERLGLGTPGPQRKTDMPRPSTKSRLPHLLWRGNIGTCLTVSSGRKTPGYVPDRRIPKNESARCGSFVCLNFRQA